MSNKKTARRLLGMTLQGNKPIFAPKETHSLLIAPAGSGKTTCGAVPWLQSLLADDSRTLVITDTKDGEIAAQCADMCAKYGRHVAIVDDFNRLGEDNPYKVSLNRFGAILKSHRHNKGELVFSSENACQAMIEEPPRDQRNFYFRSEPRTIIEFCIHALLSRHKKMLSPGSVWSLLANPKQLIKLAKIEQREGDEAIKALAIHVLGMTKNEEHWPQHLAAARTALRVYGASSTLHHAGIDASHTHSGLIKKASVIFLVGPVRYMERLGLDYALQIQSFMEVILDQQAGPISFILEEFTNAPLRSLVSQLTTMRGYGASVHMIAQSRSEIQRKYGDKETQTIEDNSVIRQFFGFSSYEEAEKISRAMGETRHVSTSLGVQSNRMDFSTNYSTGKERLYTPDMLMSLPKDEQIIFVKDIGFIHARKISQHQIAPYAYDLADNPLEGARLEPDPLITLH